MYELIQVGEKTFYIASPAKIGIYCIDDENVCLFDSGLDTGAAKRVYKVLQEKNWNLSMIINSHSHADHIGGNAFLQEKTGCNIYCAGVDRMFVLHPELESSYLFGGFPNKDLRHKFLAAKKSDAKELTDDVIPDGLEIIRLDGHAFSHIGIKTSDKVWFLGDAITTEEIIEKYHVVFLCDVKKTFESLNTIKCLQGLHFLPSHGSVCENIEVLAEKNIAKMNEIIDFILSICNESKSTETIIQRIFTHYNLTMTFAQNVLVGSTIRSYLSYLYDEGKLEALFENNLLVWKSQ